MTAKSEYGRALFMLACEDGALDRVKDDLDVINRVLEENPDYARILDTPAIPKSKKVALADEAFAPLCESVSNLMKILTEKHSVSSFKDVFSTYNSLYDEYMGIINAEAVTAVAMNDGQIDALRMKLEETTGKKIVIKNTVDKKIVAGIKIRYDGKQIDGSVKTRLDAFYETIKNTVI